jgi:hypothetical protein
MIIGSLALQSNTTSQGFFYRYQVFHLDHPELRFCDMSNPVEASYNLFVTGQMLMYHNSLLPRLIKDKDFFGFTLRYECETNPKCESILERYRNGHYPGKRPSRREWVKITSESSVLDAYRVSHHLCYFLTPIWIWYEALFSPMACDNGYAMAGYYSTFVLMGHTCGLAAILRNGDSAIIGLLDYFMLHGEDVEEWLKLWMDFGGATALLWGAVNLPQALRLL